MTLSTRTAALIGPGRLAWSLIPALQAADIRIHALIGRREEQLGPFSHAYPDLPTATDFAAIPPNTDWIFLTVGDQAIASVASDLAGKIGKETWVFHTSGSTPLQHLAPLGPQVGVFYPLQIFTFDQVVPFEQVPLFLELPDRHPLWTLAHRLSPQVHPMDSATRLRLHMGAVWVVNFTNYLFRVGLSNLPGAIPFEVYRPLIHAHLEKAFAFGPEQTQTGPAIRGDDLTIKQHLEMLQAKPDWQSLYRTLSQAINPDLKV